MLIGSQLFQSLLCVGQISLGQNKPILQKTKFGWIVSGPLGIPTNNKSICNFAQINIQNQLAKFWELKGNNENDSALSLKEKLCEADFVKRTKRKHDGRFIVKLPLNNSIEMLGDSYSQALRRLLKLCYVEYVEYVN